jgi:hypothetical protein
MRDTLKTLTSVFSAATTPYPLPDELHQTIEAFLGRYHDIEDHDSQRFHEDLVALYKRYVADDTEKRAAFLPVLRLVRPALTGESRWDEWWNLVLRPIIDSTGHKRHVVEDAREVLLSILVFETKEDHDGENAQLSHHFMHKLLDIYLTRARLDHGISPENEFISQEIEATLIAFGRRNPKVRSPRYQKV